MNPNPFIIAYNDGTPVGWKLLTHDLSGTILYLNHEKVTGYLTETVAEFGTNNVRLLRLCDYSVNVEVSISEIEIDYDSDEAAILDS